MRAASGQSVQCRLHRLQSADGFACGAQGVRRPAAHQGFELGVPESQRRRRRGAESRVRVQLRRAPAGFDHTLQVTLVDAKGRIRRQIYGDRFTADALGEPLKQLLTGARLADGATFRDLIDRVRILCSIYDPDTGAYRADYTLYIEIAGGVTFLAAMIWMALSEWRSRRLLRLSLRSLE